jgi:hypothetical protein
VEEMTWQGPHTHFAGPVVLGSGQDRALSRRRCAAGITACQSGGLGVLHGGDASGGGSAVRRRLTDEPTQPGRIVKVQLPKAILRAAETSAATDRCQGIR